MQNFIKSARSGITRLTDFGDIILAGLLMAVISIMILPLPTPLVDTLIALNLSISLMMLMLATYIPSALAFSVFPSMLLFTTLFRLALNVSTTRLILLGGNAGEIIKTFGNFVVGGNFIVGAVVFLILTIVQFLVVAKGSERVAEVGARFTLDAMPGKQMSIDADMRAGNIDMEEAKRRRDLVTQESQLFGAMDGAMKFVKGDAIAGLIVSAINIIGGVAIGYLQKGLSTGDALQLYGILTIGDGLVSQIPSMLISITAGIVVTRVAKDGAQPLGKEIGVQFFAQPKALLLAGILICLFAMIPGFPKVQFLVLGIVIVVIGYTLTISKKKPATEDTSEDERLKEVMSASADSTTPRPMSNKEQFSITIPLLVDIHKDVQQNISVKQLNDEVIRIRHALYHEMGVPFPGINLRFVTHLAPNSYSVLLHEVPVSSGYLLDKKVFVAEQAKNLRMMGFQFEQGENFLPNIPSVWMPEAAVPKLIKANLRYYTLPQILTLHLSYILKRHASEFIGMQETRYLLTNMETRFAELAREVQRIMPVQRIADIFQRLVQEHISIRNLRCILETLIEWGPKEKDNVLLAEYVRIALKRQISYQFSGGLNILSAYIFNPEVEDIMRDSVRQTASGSYLALPPDTHEKIMRNIRHELGSNNKAVLLVSMDIRRFLRKMIEQEFYETAVLSYQELASEISVQPLGRITL
ncbi:MAG: type III secretion system export apparatus subunit SctV [Pseudomonadota bacterium]